jgi:nitroreductase
MAMTDLTELLRSRYGTIPFNGDIDWNDSLTTLLCHRSIRAYLPTPLPPGTLELLVAAAQSASTSSNLQTWSVVAVEDAERKERLSPPNFYRRKGSNVTKFVIKNTEKMSRSPCYR